MTSGQRLAALLGTWSRPPDVPAKVALALAALFGLAAVMGRGRTVFFGFGHDDNDDEQRTERRRFVLAAGLAAGLLSIAYVSTYLQGGPRIVDATTYFLQGRALSHGDLSWTPLDPSASFRGRFLLYRDGEGGASLAGIFPPGYPLVLAFGFMLGAPMIVGPLLAIGLVIATYHLARALAEDALPTLAEPIARAAALLSVFSAALRYHTADTMSHGASALGITIALTCAVRARQARARADASRAPGTADTKEERGPLDGGRIEALFAGVALGFVVATRPVSALPIAAVIAWLLRPVVLPDGRRARLLVLAVLGSLPGLFLLLLSQRVASGSWLESTQRMYYAISDGPPGCFRWGFGKGTGCIFEHGDFVDARLKDGYGLTAAAGTTLRRLHKHVLDVANLEPLALLVLVPALLRKRHVTKATAIIPATLLVLLQMLAYVPFYFDGDYPGGGARFFADVLPVEHALVMIGIASLVTSPTSSSSPGAPAIATSRTDIAFTRRAMLVLGLALAGFAVHASYEHLALRDRDGGRPMFEPDVLARASLTSGLVFVDTDHGFALGHDPTARPKDRVVVARLRSDDRDRMIFDALGRPPSYLYKLEPPAPPSTQSTPTLTPWAPPESGASLRFEGEAEWPPLSQEHGFAVPASASCASGGRALVLTPEAGRHAKATITVPIPSAGRWAVEVHTVSGARVPFSPPGAEATSEGQLAIGRGRWSWRSQEACKVLPVKELELRPPHEVLTLEASGGPIGIDYVSLRKIR